MKANIHEIKELKETTLFIDFTFGSKRYTGKFLIDTVKEVRL